MKQSRATPCARSSSRPGGPTSRRPSTSCPWAATRASRVRASFGCRVDRRAVHTGKAVRQAGRFRTKAVHREGSRSRPDEFRLRGRAVVAGVRIERLLLVAVDPMLTFSFADSRPESRPSVESWKPSSHDANHVSLPERLRQPSTDFRESGARGLTERSFSGIQLHLARF